MSENIAIISTASSASAHAFMTNAYVEGGSAKLGKLDLAFLYSLMAKGTELSPAKSSCSRSLDLKTKEPSDEPLRFFRKARDLCRSMASSPRAIRNCMRIV